MSRLHAYRDGFPNAHLKRSKSGVLEVALHAAGDTLVFNGHTHEQFVDLFHAIGSDSDNRVVVLTGSGDAFIETISAEGFDFFTPQGYEKIYCEARKVLINILDIEVPLIAAVNGPARQHSEYILLADIVLATPSAVFQDKPHFQFGIVRGDGVPSAVAGSDRQRRRPLFHPYPPGTRRRDGQGVGRRQRDRPRQRAASSCPRDCRRTRQAAAPHHEIHTHALAQKLRRIIDEGTILGLALEGISAADVARTSKT